MDFRQVRIIWKKEMVDLFRDRKTWLVSVLLPFLFIPGLMALLFNMESRSQEAARKDIPIVVQGEQAQIVAALTRNPGIRVVHVNDPQQALKDGEIRAIVKLDPQINEKLQRNQTAVIEVFYDPTNPKSAIAQTLLERHLQAVQEQLVAARLARLQLSPEIVKPLDIQSRSVATEQQKTGGLLAFILPFLLVVSTASGGMAAAVDLVAGEKERGTLEALLTAPVHGISVLTGKWLTVTVMGCISALASVCSLLLAFRFAPQLAGLQGGDFPDPVSAVSGANVALLLLFLVLLSMMFAALMLALSSLAKSFKEAQTYITPVLLVAMVPSYLTMSLAPNEIPTAYFFIPVLNVVAVMKQLFYGVTQWGAVLGAMGSTGLFVALAMVLAATLFRRESLIVKG